MKKRIASLLLTLVMVLGLVPVFSISAFASTSYVSSAGDSRINTMLKNIETQNFTGSGVNVSQVQNYMRHFMFDSSFAAIGGGTFNYPNSGAYTYHVSDGTYSKDIRGSTGCCAYSYFVSKVVYDDVANENKMYLSNFGYSANGLKSMLLRYAQAGEHLRADPTHSVAFISGDEEGFYCFSYCGDSNPVIRLDYWTYADFMSRYSGYTIFLYNANKADNSESKCSNGHSYGSSYSVSAKPTETSTGKISCYCTRCGASRDVTLPKLNTSDYTYKVISAASCSANGMGRYTWKKTQYGTFSFDVTIPKTTHSYSYSLATAPTETTAGQIKGKCAKCGGVESIGLPAFNFTDYTYEVIGEPTCTKGVIGRYTWNNKTYGEYHFDKEFPSLGHGFYDCKVLTAPTADKSGVLQCNCIRCDASKTVTLPAFNTTDYSSEVIGAGNCTKGVTVRYTWKNTQYGDFSFDYEFTPAGHNYVDGVCSVCGDISPDMMLPFTDVKSNQWYYNDVRFVYARGLMTGVEDTSFAPNSSCTRAMIVTVLWRMEGSPEPLTLSHFSDVAPTAWYAKQVAWAAEQGIVNGIDAAHFAPNDNITRQQLAAIMYRYADMKGDTDTGEKDISDFPDALKVQSYAWNAFRWAYGNGIIGGTTENGVTYLNPNGSATRCQIAAILHRYIDNFAK